MASPYLSARRDAAALLHDEYRAAGAGEQEVVTLGSASKPNVTSMTSHSIIIFFIGLLL